MGGEGSMLHMVISYKANRDLIKSIKPFKRYRDTSHEGSHSRHTDAEFKKPDPVYLSNLKRKLERKRRLENTFLLSFLFLILTAVPVLILVFV